MQHLFDSGGNKPGKIKAKPRMHDVFDNIFPACSLPTFQDGIALSFFEELLERYFTDKGDISIEGDELRNLVRNLCGNVREESYKKSIKHIFCLLCGQIYLEEIQGQSIIFSTEDIEFLLQDIPANQIEGEQLTMLANIISKAQICCQEELLGFYSGGSPNRRLFPGAGILAKRITEFPSLLITAGEKEERRLVRQPNVGKGKALYFRVCLPLLWFCLMSGHIKDEKFNFEPEKIDIEKKRARFDKSVPPGYVDPDHRFYDLQPLYVYCQDRVPPDGDGYWKVIIPIFCVAAEHYFRRLDKEFDPEKSTAARQSDKPTDILGETL